jgi:hypothetical protein
MGAKMSLPTICAARHSRTRKPIFIYRDQPGYVEARSPDFDPDSFNSQNGITEQQKLAMVAGAMFGWDCPAANPEIYDQ